jgi:hypothetical protein
MSISILKPKDFVAGLAYCAMGLTGIVLAREYEFGDAGNMGPGYFPTLIGGCLTLIGVISVARSFVVAGERVPNVAWRPLILVTLSVVLFAYFVPRLGLIASLAVLLVVAIFANRGARLTPLGVAAAASLIGFCVVVFVNALGVPLPLLGTWVGG